MFKLVIVEDEDHIRHSLECFIPWDTLGFQVVNTFADGSDALAYLKENPCDVVLTDIMMRRMNGLELIRNLHELRPEIKTVILSGHSNFGYAQQAIQYQVVHYLVKPVDEDELMGVFKGIKEQLDFEAEEHLLMETENRDIRYMLQKSFFRELLTGQVTTESELSAYIKLLGMEGLEKTSPLVAFAVEAKAYEREELPDESSAVSPEDVLRQLEVSAGQHLCFVAEDKADRWRVVFVGAPQEEDGTDVVCTQKVRECVASLNEQFPYTFAFRQTNCVSQITDLLTGNQEQSAETEQDTDELLRKTVVADYRLLMVELNLGSQDTVLYILDRMLLALRSTTLENARFVLKNLYSVVELNYRKRKVNVSELTDGRFDPDRLSDLRSLDAMADCLREDFAALCEGLKNRKPENMHSIVEGVIQYLYDHMDEDIGHEVLAAKYRVHPGYLSRLFKQAMGETLSEYLLRMKIQRAAELLKVGNYKVSEIAVMVGYSASSYFSIMFRKHTGYSPREYCQRISS